jgi:hypothetical protein
MFADVERMKARYDIALYEFHVAFTTITLAKKLVGHCADVGNVYGL